MNDFDSYWVILGDNIAYPSLASAKAAIRKAVDDGSWTKRFYGNEINHFVKHFKRSTLRYWVNIYGHVRFTRPLRI